MVVALVKIEVRSKDLQEDLFLLHNLLHLHLHLQGQHHRMLGVSSLLRQHLLLLLQGSSILWGDIICFLSKGCGGVECGTNWQSSKAM